MSRDIVKGSVDQSTVIRVVDSTDGTPEAPAFDTAGIDLWYRRDGGLKVSITEITLAAANSTHADGGFIHFGNGYCRLDMPDAACATGTNEVMFGGEFTGMVVIGSSHQLVDVNPYDAVRGGMTSLPNVAFAAVGGLDSPIIDTGTAQSAGAGANTIVLAAGAPAVGLTKHVIRIKTATTGAGQLNVITTYDTGTKAAVVQDDWSPALTGTITYEVLKYSSATDPASLDEITTNILAAVDAGDSVLINANNAALSILVTNQGTPTNFGSGATLSNNLVDIEGQTDDIGVAGAGLTGIATAVWASVTRTLTGGLPLRVTKNIAFSNFSFPMINSTDHVTRTTGLTVTAQRRIDSGSFSACANAVTEIGATGRYTINLANTDTNGDSVLLKFTAAGADDLDILLTPHPA